MEYDLHLQAHTYLDLTTFCDANWKANLVDCRSTSGHGIYMGTNLIACTTTKTGFYSR